MTELSPPSPEEVAARRHPFIWEQEFGRQRWLAIGLTAVILAGMAILALTAGIF